MKNKMEKEKKTIDNLAIELFKIYKESNKKQPFNVGISYANHNNHLKYIINMKALLKSFKIESLYFDPNDMRNEFTVYWHQYKNHKIKDGKLKIILNSGYKRDFDLK